MIALNEENRITVPTAGFEEAVFFFPSFADLKEPIVRLQKRKVVIAADDVQVRTNPERIRLFDQNVIRTEGLPARNGTDGQADLVELSDLPDWKGKVPAPSKIAATSAFDEGASQIIEPEAFGDPVRVEVDALFGKVVFLYPPFDDPDMTAALQFLMDDRVRRRGRRIQDRTLDIQIAFQKRVCKGIEGVDDDTWPIESYPACWTVAACRAFERSEALTGEELGN